MKENLLWNRLAQRLYRTLCRRAWQPSADVFPRPAIIFSPHQDDETLGCGGTIIRKVEAEAAVQVVFMTDGHQSHKHLMDPQKLAEIRKAEALAACAALGVPEPNITFLDLPDGQLSEHLDDAAVRINELLGQSAATDLFLPYRGEPTADHRATHAIVRQALARQEKSYTVFEYPVWFWHHWPWVTVLQPNRRDTGFVLKNTLRAAFGLRLLLCFRCCVPIAAVHERKRAALNEHKSQMTKLMGDPGWLTLHDVSYGQFLNNLLQDHEFFYQYVHPAAEERH